MEKRIELKKRIQSSVKTIKGDKVQYKGTSVKYEMPIYRVLNSLKVEGMFKNYSLNDFVNDAVRDKLKSNYPQFSKGL